MNDIERKMYQLICRNDGIKARDIAKEVGVDRADINRLLYASPFIHELCYRDDDFLWHGLIRQTRPHTGLGDFCGYYGLVDEFLKLSEEEWLEELKDGCRQIGRNLNDTRGLFHSFLDCRAVMMGLFADLEEFSAGEGQGHGDGGGQDSVARKGQGSDADEGQGGAAGNGQGDAGEEVEWKTWEICFELRIRRARYIRIYADVLVITPDKVFSLEFKMKDVIDPEEELQAVKYAKYLDVIFGDEYDVIPALVLTRASDLYTWQPLPGSSAELPVCSGDMLFNLFDEYMGFL